MESEITRLSRMVLDLSKDVEQLKQAQRQAQLDYSSARQLEFRDQYGNPRAVLGQQPDDGFAISYVPGDKPPKPSLPVTDSEELNGIIFWDGLFDGGVPRPSDVIGVDAHLGSSPTFALEDVDPDLPGEQTGTGIGSLTDRGAISYALGSDTKYVRFVSVTNAGVRSDPTDAVPITSLPVSRIQLGAVRAEHIDFAATVNGNTLSLNESGLLVARGDGSIAFYLQTSDAFVLATGEYRTQDTGARLVINPGGGDPDTIFGYPDTGTGVATISAFTPEVGKAGWLVNASNADPDAGRIAIAPDYAVMFWGGDDHTTSDARLHLFDRVVRAQAPVAEVIADHALTAPSGSHRVVLKHIESGGGDYVNGSLELRLKNAGNEAFWYCPGKDIGLLFGSLEFHVWNNAGAYRPINASAFVVNSSEETKSDIQQLPVDPVDTIMAAEPMAWRRSDDPPDGPIQVGPMIEDLPDYLIRDDEVHGQRYDVVSLVGVLWSGFRKIRSELIETRQIARDAVTDLRAKNTAQQAQIDDLLARVAALESQANA